jgi:hypothetical protein
LLVECSLDWMALEGELVARRNCLVAGRAIALNVRAGMDIVNVLGNGPLEYNLSKKKNIEGTKETN